MDALKYKVKIARKLKAARIGANMSQKELADRMNVYTTQISRWESGMHSLDLYTAYWLAKVLDVSMDWLFGD